MISKNNIILIGFMGSGKSTVGRKAARAFQYQFLDTDYMIERRYHKRITAIFAEEGEAFFRKAETDLLKKLQSKKDSFLLATGGGLPMKEENRLLLKKLGRVVFLSSSPDEILKRLSDDRFRPLLQREDKDECIRKLYEERYPVYQSIADEVVDTGGKSFYAILTELEKRGIVKGSLISMNADRKEGLKI